ncbi:MAG: hypothetical protein ACUVTL_05165 [Thermoproteota archaeon]
MRYVPKGAEKIAIINFSQIFLKTGNESLFSTQSLLVIYNFSTELKIHDVEFSATALYRNPDPNMEDIALNIVKPKQHLYLELRKELEEKGEMEFSYKGYTIIQVTEHVVNKPTISFIPTPEYVKGYIVMNEGYLLYSEGMVGMELIKRSLDTLEESSQFFEQQQIKAPLYLLLSKMGDELGFSYSTLPCTVRDVVSTSISIRFEEGLNHKTLCVRV